MLYNFEGHYAKAYEMALEVWAERKDYKDYGGYGEEKTEEHPHRLYLDADRAQYDAWSGKKYASLEPRQGSYVEMGLIYQPPTSESERAVAGVEEEPAFALDDELPF